jgi:hypothetical protein
MRHVARRAELLFRESQVEEAAVVGEELNADPAKDGFEIGRRQNKPSTPPRGAVKPSKS